MSERRYDIDPETDCWIWKGSLNGRGYGTIRISGKTEMAHRLSFLLHKGGLLPPFQQVDHLCRNRACVNPDHLEAVTCAENVQRGALAKLSVEDVRAIRAAGAEITHKALGSRFGVTGSTIRMVRLGKTWSSVR